MIGKENPSQEDYNKFSDHLLEMMMKSTLNLFGRFIEKTDKIYTNSKYEPIYNIKVAQILRDPNGNLIKKQKPAYLQSNINEEHIVK